MNKKLKILLWCLSVLVVIGVAGLFAANYAIDKVLGSLSSVSVADVTENVEADTPKEPVQASNESAEVKDGVDEVDSSSEDAIADQDSSDQDATSTNSKPQSTDKDASKVVASDPELDKIDTYSAAVSEDKAKAIEENVTLSEKTKVASTLLSSLSASDISTLQKLASGGLTVEEKKQARDLMLEKLTEEQYDDLIAIAAKYGVSQGRKYSEVVND